MLPWRQWLPQYSALFYWAIVSLIHSVYAFEVTLNPDPKQSAIGHRPVGMPLAVLCTVSGLSDDSRPGMLWTKAHSDISKTGNVDVQRIDAFTLSLQIRNSSVEDSGVYVCTASFKNETRSVLIDVNIFQELQFLDGETEMKAPSIGKSLNISCRFQPFHFSDSNLEIIWEKGIVAVTDAAKGYSFHENGQVLEIINFDPLLHEGTYHCKVMDKRAGIIMSKHIKLGGNEKRLRFCNSLCNALCNNFYTQELKAVAP